MQAWYGGNETGNAIADVLFGETTPSGKLSLSWPIRVEDNPAFLNYRSERGEVVYGEGSYVGYRFYEKTKKDVLFPFGHGLSYTTFSMSNTSVESPSSDFITVSVDVKNTGSVDGAEVVQVYISQRKPSVQRPPKELKGFKKVQLKKGESQKWKQAGYRLDDKASID
jgi:beta-glucosidase